MGLWSKDENPQKITKDDLDRLEDILDQLRVELANTALVMTQLGRATAKAAQAAKDLNQAAEKARLSRKPNTW